MPCNKLGEVFLAAAGAVFDNDILKWIWMRFVGICGGPHAFSWISIDLCAFHGCIGIVSFTDVLDLHIYIYISVYIYLKVHICEYRVPGGGVLGF